jgi:uncharacterized membrane protein (UPF0127 family)
MLKRALRIALLIAPALALLACGTNRSGSRLPGPSDRVSTTSVATNSPPSPSASAPATPQGGADLRVIRFDTASGGQALLSVEVESTDAERQRGLMGVTSLPENQGQLFVFQDIAPNQDVMIGFWMKDTLIPLSLAFISANGYVEQIVDMQPQTLDVHTAQQSYRYAVEANQGWFARHGVTPGARVDLSAALGQ